MSALATHSGGGIQPAYHAATGTCGALTRYITTNDWQKYCAGVPPSQQVRLRWANQVEALPPAYQAAGAGVLNDILGPSTAQSSGAGDSLSGFKLRSVSMSAIHMSPGTPK